MKQLLTAFLGLLLLSSCTSLQYRLNDKAIDSAFAKADIPSHISYINIDSLDLKIRVLSVVNDSLKYNIVFLHGSPSSLTAWRSYMKDSTLISKANLHAIDRPGYGYSKFGNSFTSIDLQTKLINQVILEKQLQNVIAVGTSYGGPVAARLAVLNKEVKAVLLLSPAIDPENEKRVWQSYLTQFWLTRWLVPTGYRVAGDEKTTHVEELASIEKDWPLVTIPVLHIHGDKDDLVPYVNIEYSKRVFSNVEIVTIESLGHEIAWKYPDLVIPYLLQMIEQLEN